VPVMESVAGPDQERSGVIRWCCGRESQVPVRDARFGIIRPPEGTQIEPRTPGEGRRNCLPGR
jgi:hypothetical protein